MAKIVVYAAPTWLYRYRPLRPRGFEGADDASRERLDRELRAIEENYIWCSNFERMNDPMEGFYRSGSSSGRSQEGERLSETMWNEKSSLGIASLSETWDSELMWAHYADGFRGICVTYKVRNLLRGLGEDCGLTRVSYGDRPYYLNMRDRRNSDVRARAALSTKSHRWSYEREWRLFAPQCGAAHHGTNVVAAVSLGHRMADEDKDYIVERLANSNVRVWQTHVDGYSIERS